MERASEKTDQAEVQKTSALGWIEKRCANPVVLEKRAELEDFIYDDASYEAGLGTREEREEVLLEDGARYRGERLTGRSIR